MLAYNGLALITEKLQNQRLEEASPPSGNTGTFCGTNKLPQVSPEGNSHRTTSQSNLAVKGKNVWALSLESERQGHVEMTADDVRVSNRLQEKAQTPTASICRHRKLRHMCQICCDRNIYTPTAPPKKKHCRSLSVPPDCSVSFPSTSRESGAKIWRPIAVIPLSNSNTTTSAFSHNTSSSSNTIMTINSSGSVSYDNSSVIQFRHDNRHRDFSNPNSSDSISPTCPFFSEMENVASGKLLPKRHKSGSFVNLLPPPSSPSAPSPPSVDSGHFTTSDLQTPPGSPVPRPASAASSDFSSFGSLNCPWLESSPMRSARVRILENRSLSMEDRISGSASSTASTQSFHSAGYEPCPYRCRSSSSNDGSGEGCGDSVGGPCSIGVIPRCHSQPCVLHHRRCGKKRRRDCDNRPTLNFNKMTETAYTRLHRRSEPWNSPVNENQMRVPQHNFIDIVRNNNSSNRGAFCLNPIASSPLDSELHPIMSSQLASSKTFLGADLSQAASIALPLTPPEFGSPNPLGRRAETEERIGDSGEEEEEDVEYSEQQDCNCHDSRTDDGVGLFPMSDLDLDQIENH